MTPAMLIPTNRDRNARTCGDNEAPCVICNRPVKLLARTKMVWVHKGGSHVVTVDEGNRLNDAGEAGGDLGGQPIGSDCLRRHPEIVPYLIG